MNLKFSLKLLLAATSLISINAVPQSSNAEPEKDRVNFYCGEYTDQSSKETIPATMAYVPQRGDSVSIIAWKSSYIPAWDAQTRCETVSPKFQALYEESLLNYLTTGKVNNYDVICAAIEEGETCNGENQLFQVKANDNPQAVLKGLTGIIEGQSSEPLYQSSGEKIYVQVDKLLDAAPTLKEVSEASE